ncbi:hypothetical protein HPULCUR_011627 [Helicostylum pulchrum]|uniref:Uncharacterized protein n=1 Tax=Helicostylum pulchrum TaxID=562976 RepID=A0ABP9YGL1_9FUNG
MDQPNLQQQRLDQMALFQSSPSFSSTLQDDQQVSPSNTINSESDNFVEDPIVQEYTEDEFEAVDEEAGGSACEDSFVSKYLASIQSKLKGGVTLPEYRRKTYWVNVEYGGFDYNTRTSPDIFYRPRVFIWLPDLLTSKKASGVGKIYLKCPKCTANLERKEFAKKTKARRIIDQLEYVSNGLLLLDDNEL